MTRCLYWEEPYASEFDGRIVRLAGEGDGPGVVLDRTLFHPEGGGQPCDTGYLTLLDHGLAAALGSDRLHVTDVLEKGGDIVHMIDGSVPLGAIAPLPDMPEGGWQVHGRIDWDRRFDLMQQHTGQHILSRAFLDVLTADTVGFHLSKEYVSIDLDVQGAAPADVARVEDRANQVVFQDMPVVVKEYGRGDLPRDVRARFEINAGSIRVIHIGEFDACPCGGTHVSSTGQIGLIKVNQIDRAHGGLRVVFRCGGRALADYREKQELLDETARVLSQPPQSVPATARALGERLQSLQEELGRTQEGLLELEIDSLVRPENLAGRESVIVEMASRSPEQLKYAAKKIAEQSRKLTVCFAREPRFSAVVASLGSFGPDARKVVSAVASAWGGRGGGTPQLAQLGSKEPLGADPSAVADSLKRICREMLREVES